MDKEKIVGIINESPGIGDIQEIDYKPDFLVLRVFYDYDEDELDAARDYANNQADSDTEEDKWYDEYFIPYLIDIAVDEVRDTMEQLVENHGLNVEYISYEPERDDNRCEFIAAFADEGNEFDIDEILDALEI